MRRIGLADALEELGYKPIYDMRASTNSGGLLLWKRSSKVEDQNSAKKNSLAS
jgi:hypothetical protein